MTQGNMIGRQRSRNVRPRRSLRFVEKNDIISTMPDDILTNIVSRLSVKEAARTSLLSTRWRTRWTNFSGVLDFDYSLRSFALRRERSPIVKSNAFVTGWENFMASVEHIMKTLTSSSIEGLRICMDLGHHDKIIEWLKFAEERNLKMLDLDFQFNFSSPFYETSSYIHRQMLFNNFRLESLCVLRMANMDVSGEVIEGFLASSPKLETLCIRESRILENLRVSGAELMLKHLELVDCNHLVSLSISAKNLLTFKFVGCCEDIKFESVPRLMEVSFGGWYCNFLQMNMNNSDFHGLLSQVHVLKLEFRGYYLTALEYLHVFHNVKHLELQISPEYESELKRTVTLLSVFPSASVLKIKFTSSYRLMVKKGWVAYMENKLPNLTQIEISGYREEPNEIELLVTLFKNAPNLKRLLMDPLSHMERIEDVQAWVRIRRRMSARRYLENLKPSLPSSVDLIIL